MNSTYSSNCLTFVCNHLNYSDFAEKLLLTEVTINSNNIIMKFKAFGMKLYEGKNLGDSLRNCQNLLSLKL